MCSSMMCEELCDVPVDQRICCLILVSSANPMISPSSETAELITTKCDTNVQVSKT